MKKRVLLTLLFVLLFSLLAAFSVSAQEYELIDDLGDPSWYTGNYQYMTDKTSQVVLVDSDGNYTAYPAYYILKYSITVSEGAVTAASISSVDYSHVSRDGKSYSAGAIYKIELPEGLTTIKSNLFGYYPTEENVVEIIMSDTIKTVEAHAFRNDKSDKKLHLKKVVFSKNLTSLGAHAFLNVSTLETIEFPGGSDAELDMSAQQIFMGCTSLQSADLSKRNIKIIGGSCFNGCSSLGKVTLPDTITHFDSQCFYYCRNMYFASDFLPSSLKVAGFHFLSGCTNINDVLFFPDGFESFGNECFDTEKGNPGSITLVFLGKMTGTVTLNKLAPRNVDVTLIFTQNTFSDLSNKYVMSYQNGNTIGYMGKSADGNNYKENTAGTLSLTLGNPADMNSKIKEENGNTYYYVNTSQCNNIYFCGGDTVEYCRDVRTSQVISGTTANLITSPYTFDMQGHMTANVHYDLSKIISEPSCGDDGVTEKICVVCDRVAQDIAPATGNHTLVLIGPCADKCSVCLHYVQRTEQSHALNEQYKYSNGYLAVGSFDTTCTNEGCNLHLTGELNPIFKDFKYSKREGNVFGLVMVYKVDKEALALYEEKAKTEVTFGVLAIAQSNVNAEESLVKNDGTTSYNKIIVANVSDKVPSTVTLLISGAESQWEQHKETPFYILGYAINNGVVEYFQNESNIDVNKLSTITYGSVTVDLPSEEVA